MLVIHVYTCSLLFKAGNALSQRHSLLPLCLVRFLLQDCSCSASWVLSDEELQGDLLHFWGHLPQQQNTDAYAMNLLPVLMRSSSGVSAGYVVVKISRTHCASGDTCNSG